MHERSHAHRDPKPLIRCFVASRLAHRENRDWSVGIQRLAFLVFSLHITAASGTLLYVQQRPAHFTVRLSPTVLVAWWYWTGLMSYSQWRCACNGPSWPDSALDSSSEAPTGCLVVSPVPSLPDP